MSDFLLKKWYLDAADVQGHVFIGYWVSLRWGNIQLHGYQLLQRSPGQRVKSQGGFSEEPAPSEDGKGMLVWAPGKLIASWRSSLHELSAVMLRTDQGDIRWCCKQPKAEAYIQLPDLQFTGWGYTECIELTVPIWRLPFSTLYWGRCHTENHYLVWIKWDGLAPIDWLWHNGTRSGGLTIEDDAIRDIDFELRLKDKIPLRRGELASTVFRRYGQILRLFPKSTFSANEQKWYSHGILEADGVREAAIVIHERVSW